MRRDSTWRVIVIVAGMVIAVPAIVTVVALFFT